MKGEEGYKWLKAVIERPEVCGGNEADNTEALEAVKRDIELLNTLKKWYWMDKWDFAEGVKTIEETDNTDDEAKALFDWLYEDLGENE